MNRDWNKDFSQIIDLQQATNLEWELISRDLPFLPRGWFELARLPIDDRIEFTHAYWRSTLSFMEESLERRLNDFFHSVHDIGIFATQVQKQGKFEVHMMYSLKADGGFFQGSPPASDEAIEMLQMRFGHIQFPNDYLSFLRIHDGFSKYTDTGIIKLKEMAQVYQRLQHLLVDEILVRPDGEVIHADHLIPFYESFGLHNYQCFYADWQLDHGMGNVYFSEYDRTISNFLEEGDLEESLAFPSFLAWLLFYLEDIWHFS